MNKETWMEKSKGGIVQAPWHRVSVGAGKQGSGNCHQD